MKPYYEHAKLEIWQGDALDILPSIGGADLIIADPPYTFGLVSTMNEQSKSGSWADLMNNARWYSSWITECKRITANRDGALWVFTSWRTFPVLARAAFLVPWPITSLLVWNKDWIGPGGLRGLRPSYELVALFAHDKFSMPNRALYDIWTHPWSSRKPSGHPAEKPLSLVRQLIQESGGSMVLDPFLGSGTTLVAAKELGLKGIGIEMEKSYCDMAIERLSQEVLHLRRNDGTQREEDSA